jgi:hypothetical protein
MRLVFLHSRLPRGHGDTPGPVTPSTLAKTGARPGGYGFTTAVGELPMLLLVYGEPGMGQASADLDPIPAIPFRYSEIDTPRLFVFDVE